MSEEDADEEEEMKKLMERLGDPTEGDTLEEIVEESPFTYGESIDLDPMQFTTGGGYQSSRNYKCPNCGGEFDRWEKKDRKKACPFCGLEKFSYEPDKGE